MNKNFDDVSETTADTIKPDFTSDHAVFKIADAVDLKTNRMKRLTHTKNPNLLSPISIAPITAKDAVFNYLSAPMVKKSDDGKSLILSHWPKSMDDHTILDSGENYVVRTTGVFRKAKNGSADFKVTNIAIKITGFEHMYILDESKNYAPSCVEIIKGQATLASGKTYPWEVEMKNYKNIFQELTKRYGAITLSKKSGDELDVYLSDLYEAAINLNPVPEISVQWSGWYELESKPAQYLIGKEKTGSCFANLADCDKLSIFSKGLDFLRICNQPTSAIILFEFMHAAFSRFWLKKAGIGWNMCLLVQGETNSGKTSLLKLACDILNHDRTAGLIQLGSSTEAGMRRTLNTEFRDTMVCLDDFSNSNSKSTRNAYELVEAALRLVGDDSGRIKAGSGQKTVREKADCVLAVTAEEHFNLAASSQSRYITIHLHREKRNPDGSIITLGTVNKDYLTLFQSRPEILHGYFSLFIKYLTENGYRITEEIKAKALLYRQEYASVFELGRLVDAAVRLNIQADIICAFALWSGLASAETSALSASMKNAILSTIKEQERLFFEAVPSKVFIQALADCFDFSKEVAPDEDQYLEYPESFVGFYSKKDGTVWLNKETVNSRVLAYIHREGIHFRISEKNIPKLLHDDGYTKATFTTKDGVEHASYLPRSKKGSSSCRKGMYVFYTDKIKDFFYKED